MRGSRYPRAVLPLMLASWIGGTSLAGDLAPASPVEPFARALSLERAAGYLDDVALDWTRERKCGTCHTNYAYMLSRPAVRGFGSPDAMKEIREFFESRAGHWVDAAKVSKPRWDAEVIATAVTLAINDGATIAKSRSQYQITI